MNVNPLVWYGTRQLKLAPPHFTKCTTPLSDKSLIWVTTKLQGRFSTEDVGDDDIDALFMNIQNISFEDPAEAMLYELRWAGTK